MKNWAPGRAVRLLSLFCCLVASPAWAGPHIADFSLGISREETLLRAAEPCGDNLCGEVSFGGQDWKGSFLMKDGHLAAITLLGPLQDAYVNAAFDGFKDSPYVVYQAMDEERCFDFIKEARRGLSPAELDAAFAVFLKEMRAEGHYFASYLYTEPSIYEALKAGSAEAPVREEPTVSDGKKSAKTPNRAITVMDGTSCCLSIDEDGVSIIIMPWNELQRELAARETARANTSALKP